MFSKMPFVLFLFYSLIADAKDCFLSELRYYTNDQYHSGALTICFKMKGNHKILMSKDCFEGKCQALSEGEKKAQYTLYSAQGNPAFRLCRALGADPQLIEIKMEKGDWQSDNRCLFADGSFVRAGYLFALQKGDGQEVIIPLKKKK